MRVEDTIKQRVAQELLAWSKSAETYIKASNALLKLVTEKSSRKDYLDGVVRFIREWSGCRCIGIRVADQEGFIPYESYTGFTREFWEQENRLSLTKDDCACIRVIAGEPEPQDARCMTAGGSFLINDSVKLLGILSEEERTRFRGVCIRSGFLSIAVIPVRYEGRILGAIHLADERAGMVCEEFVGFVESMAPLVGEGINKFTVKDSLERHCEILKKTNRALKVLSECNYAMVHEADELELLEHVCKIIVETGGYRLAWAGYAEQDSDRTVKPVARAGYEEGYLDSVKITWADTQRGRGPSGTAIRTGEPSIVRNCLCDPDFAPWREAALKRGYASSIALPLKSEGHVFGALNIYAREPEAFDGEELSLLQSLAANLAYGIAALRTRQEQRRAEEALEEYARKLESLNQDLEEFAFVASHDLQEPLRKIRSFGERLNEQYKDALDECGKDYIERMTGAARRMQELLEGLLKYSRVTVQEDAFALVDLNKVVQDTVSDLDVALKRSGGTVEVGPMPILKAEEPPMRQLFQNLIGNALKYRDEKRSPVVTVSAHREGRVCRILVEDNGIGFEEKYLERIFKPFQRLHGRSSAYEGTGLGLAICRKIVERHGGSITARSVPGKGSTFILTLPAC